MTNLDSIFKSRDITLPTKVRLVKAMVFPVFMYGCESWTVKKAERRRIDAFFFFNFILFFNFTVLYWFCHISKWICHRYTHVPMPNPPPTSLPVPSLWVIPVRQPQASSIVHWTWTGNSFRIWYYTCFNAILPNHPTLSLSHRVQKTVSLSCRSVFPL